MGMLFNVEFKSEIACEQRRMQMNDAGSKQDLLATGFYVIHFDDPLEQSLPNNIGIDDKEYVSEAIFFCHRRYR